jgi:hypothetical protein
MKNILLLALVTLGLNKTAFAHGFKIYLENGQTVMSMTVESSATGANGEYEVVRYSNDGSLKILSIGQIEKGSMDTPMNQEQEIPPYFEFFNSNQGKIEILVLQNDKCQVTTKNIKSFSLKNKTLGCAIFPLTDSTPGAFSGSN